MTQQEDSRESRDMWSLLWEIKTGQAEFRGEVNTRLDNIDKDLQEGQGKFKKFDKRLRKLEKKQGRQDLIWKLVWTALGIGGGGAGYTIFQLLQTD